MSDVAVSIIGLLALSFVVVTMSGEFSPRHQNHWTVIKVATGIALATIAVAFIVN